MSEHNYFLITKILNGREIAFRNKAYMCTTVLQFWFAVCIYLLENDEIRPAFKFWQVIYG